MYALEFRVKSSMYISKFIEYEAFENDTLAANSNSNTNILPVKWTSPRHVRQKHYDTADCKMYASVSEKRPQYDMVYKLTTCYHWRTSKN